MAVEEKEEEKYDVRMGGCCRTYHDGWGSYAGEGGREGAE